MNYFTYNIRVILATQMLNYSIDLHQDTRINCIQFYLLNIIRKLNKMYHSNDITQKQQVENIFYLSYEYSPLIDPITKYLKYILWKCYKKKENKNYVEFLQKYYSNQTQQQGFGSDNVSEEESSGDNAELAEINRTRRRRRRPDTNDTNENIRIRRRLNSIQISIPVVPPSRNLRIITPSSQLEDSPQPPPPISPNNDDTYSIVTSPSSTTQGSYISIVPPTPENIPPTPENIPPTPENIPPTPENIPPTPENIPSTPQIPSTEYVPETPNTESSGDRTIIVHGGSPSIESSGSNILASQSTPHASAFVRIENEQFPIIPSVENVTQESVINHIENLDISVIVDNKNKDENDENINLQRMETILHNYMMNVQLNEQLRNILRREYNNNIQQLPVNNDYLCPLKSDKFISELLNLTPPQNITKPNEDDCGHTDPISLEDYNFDDDIIYVKFNQSGYCFKRKEFIKSLEYTDPYFYNQNSTTYFMRIVAFLLKVQPYQLTSSESVTVLNAYLIYITRLKWARCNDENVRVSEGTVYFEPDNFKKITPDITPRLTFIYELLRICKYPMFTGMFLPYESVKTFYNKKAKFFELYKIENSKETDPSPLSSFTIQEGAGVGAAHDIHLFGVKIRQNKNDTTPFEKLKKNKLILTNIRQNIDNNNFKKLFLDVFKYDTMAV